MIFQTHLIDDIIKLIAQQKSITTIEAMKHIQMSHNISRASFFRIINQLISRQLLAKEGKRIILNATWMMEYLNFSESIKLSLLESPVLRDLEVGEFQRIEGDSLVDIDPIYNDIYVRLTQKSHLNEMFHYNSHAYHMNGVPDTEWPFWTSLKLSGIKQYMIFGNTTFLDQHGAVFVRQYGWAKAILTTDHPFPRDGYIMMVVGEYIVDLSFPQYVSDSFRFFFDTIQTMKDFHFTLFNSLFQQKAKYVITISHDPERAEYTKKVLKTIIALDNK